MKIDNYKLFLEAKQEIEDAEVLSYTDKDGNETDDKGNPIKKSKKSKKSKDKDSGVKKNKDFGERTGAKVKRIVTGDHVGFDPKEGAKYPLTFLPEKKFDEIVSFWKAGEKNKAAERLRGIIIGERDTQLKIGASLILIGVSMAAKGIEDFLPDPTPTPDIKPIADVVGDGEGITQLIERITGREITNGDVSDLIDALTEFGGGDLAKGIDGISTGGADPEAVAKALEEITSNADLSGESLGKILQGEWSGTGKTLGDLLKTIAGNPVTHYN